MKNRNINLSTKLTVSEILLFMGVIIGAITLGIIISSQVFAIAGVREISMEETMYEGDRLYVNKLAYRFKQPDRGDVIIFIKNYEIKGFFDRCRISAGDILRNFSKEKRDDRLVKRVIGLPGETIEIKTGKVYINGELLDEGYTKNATFPDRLNGEYIIPEGFYFVMGDNRFRSSDSRRFGPIPIDSIEGKATTIVWPPAEWKSLDTEYNN